jgi:hypothetical protein
MGREWLETSSRPNDRAGMVDPAELRSVAHLDLDAVAANCPGVPFEAIREVE